MRLLEPLVVRGHTLRNRVVFGPHETNLASGRAIGERHVTYYRRRAEGGAALIVTETASVHPLDWPYERCPAAEDCGDGWRAVADACRAPGAKVLAGLGHSGLQGSSAYSQRETWAPSRVPDAVSRELPKEMEDDDIVAVLDGFVAAARLAVRSGCAGVEIDAGPRSLVRQFLSGLTNHRSDHWGPGEDGTGRVRFLEEVLAGVRAAVGDEALLALRLSCDELAPWAGITPDSAAELARRIAPAVDLLVVVRGSLFSAEASRPDGHTAPGFNLDLARQVSDATGGATVVVAQGSIVDPDQAEWAVHDGRAQLVEMTRAQIADPDLVDKLVRGYPDRIRPCILCNQRCQVRDSRNPVVSCTVNPSAGHEGAEPEAAAAVDAPMAQRVVVVGAGPAGLELARVAAGAGHHVEVHDRRSQTGATVRSWAVARGREQLVRIVDWLEAECRRLGVELRLDSAVGPDEVAALGAGEGTRVVLCTGSVAAPSPAPIDALSVLERLRGDELELPEGPVLVWDPVGGPVAISLAETLAEHRPVVFVTPDVIPGTLLSLTGDLAAASTRLARAGVDVRKRSVLVAVHPDHAVLEDRFTGDRTSIETRLVVDCGHRLPDDDLWGATGRTLWRAGDAVAPRTIHEAVLEGRRLACRLVDQTAPGST